jgi:acyl carrier protein
MELFLFTMHQLATPSNAFCEEGRLLSRAFLMEWLRRHRQTNPDLPQVEHLADDVQLSHVERQKLIAGLESCYDIHLPAAETDQLHTIGAVETYVNYRLGSAAA